MVGITLSFLLSLHWKKMLWSLFSFSLAVLCCDSALANTDSNATLTLVCSCNLNHRRNNFWFIHKMPWGYENVCHGSELSSESAQVPHVQQWRQVIYKWRALKQTGPVCASENRASGLRGRRDLRGLHSSRRDLAWAWKVWMDLNHYRKERKAF